MAANAVLLHEPEAETREYLARHLRDDGFAVVGAEWRSRALDLMEREAPDLVIAADAELCRQLRDGEPGRRWNRNVPVIVLARPGADAVDRVRALEHGADDVVERDLYIELVARVRSLLRRATVGQADRLDVGDLTVDLRARRVVVRGSPVALSGREFELVTRLASDPTRVFSKAELLRDLWGIGSGVRTRTIDSHASRARRKLSLAEGDRFVVNVWGVGYRLVD
ncbi:MAG: response regulator transcription factor [Gaiella sp.]